MTIGLLITGQVRDANSFRMLCEQLATMGEDLPRTVFATWPNEVLKARNTIRQIPGLELKVIDCGSPLPAEATLNRNVKSFLAQFQQMMSGFEEFILERHLVRIRADLTHPEKLPDFLRAVKASLASTKYSNRSVVLGGGVGCPFFLEDRVMILSRLHRTKLAQFPLARLFRYDPRNLFPEFVLYSIMGDANPMTVGFEYQYGHRAGLEALIRYRNAYFGNRFEEHVQDYLRIFAENFVFLTDLFNEAGLDPESGMSVIPRGYSFQELVPFRQGWSAFARSTQVADLRPDTDTTVERKKYLHALDLLYATGQSVELIKEFESVPDFGCFQPEADEYYGCSLVATGDYHRGYAYLRPLFNNGMRTFELMFYMTLAAQKLGQADLQELTSAFLDAFPSNQKAAQHVEALIRA